MNHRSRCKNIAMAAGVLAIAAAAWPPAARADDLKGLRGQRYCEIFLGTKKLVRTALAVYNTIGLNDCPVDRWNKMTVNELKRETSSTLVHLNGLRYWVIDGIRNSRFANPTPRTLGGIPMREAGVLEVPSILLKGLQAPYRAHDVKRQTTWVYGAGKPVFELIDDKGRVFIMQSYSTQRVQQTLSGLADLGMRLKLPQGWTFRTRVLAKQATLTPINQKAVVIQDDLLNTYQLETPGFTSSTVAAR